MKRLSPTLDQPMLFLRLEGGGLFVASLLWCTQLGINWWLFPLYWLLFDLSAIGYLAGPKIGAAIYNLGHTAIIPLAIVGYILMTPGMNHAGLALVAAIWLNHIGFDRLMGYGLKFSSGFKDTNLGHIGKV